MREWAGTLAALAGLILPGLGWAFAQRWPLPQAMLDCSEAQGEGQC